MTLSEALFSYGTFLDAKVQRAVFGRTLPSTRDALVGYRLVPVKIASQDAVAISGVAVHLILEPDAYAPPIEGALFYISAADLEAADRYESAEYKRIKVKLRSGKSAWAFVRR
jgi:acyl-CoA thioesterase-1